MSYEDADVAKIRGFVTKCLESVGALVEFPAYNYAEVLLPDEFAWQFDGESYFNLSFDFDVAQRHEDSEFVTYGSYFLDRVTDLATQRGLTCKRHILDENVEIRSLPQKMSGKISFRNCRATFLANAPMIYHYLLFNFKVSYISDERKDRIVRILVNLNTGHVDSNMLKAVGSAIFTDSSHTSYAVEEMRPIDDVYQAATNALEEQIQPTIHELNGRIRARMNDEKKRITEYYDQVDSELNLKRDKLIESEKKDGVKSIDDKLRLSGIERQRRLSEIEEKNALKVSVMLFSASLISQAKIRNRYSVKRGKIERSVHVVWNPILNDVDPLACEVCDSKTVEIELCSNSHLGCPRCVRVCSVCMARLCIKCGMTECAVCGDPLCDDCKIVCESCGDALCKDHTELCTCKEEKRRKAAERAERKERKKREEEERLIEERLREFHDIPLRLSKSMEWYHDKYVRGNIDALDQVWKNLMVKAGDAMAHGEDVKARAIFQQLDVDYPPNAWVKANRTLTYKRWSRKMELLGPQAVRLAPRMALAHTALAHMHEKNGHFQAAINSYEQARRVAGDDEMDLSVNALFRIGWILYDRGNLWEAERRWEKALEIDPRFTPARRALMQLYY